MYSFEPGIVDEITIYGGVALPRSQNLYLFPASYLLCCDLCLGTRICRVKYCGRAHLMSLSATSTQVLRVLRFAAQLPTGFFSSAISDVGGLDVDKVGQIVSPSPSSSNKLTPSDA